MKRKLRGACRIGPMVQRVRDALADAQRQAPDGVLSAPWLDQGVWDAMAALSSHAPERAAQLRIELGFNTDRPVRTVYQIERERGTPRWMRYRRRRRRDAAAREYETHWIRMGTKQREKWLALEEEARRG